MARFRFGLFLVALMFVFAGPLQASETVVSLRPMAEVKSNFVRLSEIATVSGPSTSHCNVLRNVEITRSPLPGQKRFVGADFIRIRLRQSGIDTDTILFTGSDDVSISRKKATLSTQQIRSDVERQIRRLMPWDDEDVVIQNISLDDTVILPAGKQSYRIIPNRNEDYLGRTVFALHFLVDGVVVRKTWVNVTISVSVDVVAVVRPLGKHQHIEPDDIVLKRHDLAKLPSDTVRNIEDALGNRTKRMIYPNTVLQSSMIVTPPMVRRGDLVKIVASSGPMTITASGRIKQQGCKGDLVKVVNTDSNRIITARVTGPGKVAVEF